jgi:hypothetical protein
MSYSTTKTISLGSANTGLTLAAQLYTSAGVASGGSVATGFVEIGGGVYLWTGTIPDDFQGIVKFTTGAIVVAASINTTDDPGNTGGSATGSGLYPINHSGGTGLASAAVQVAIPYTGTLVNCSTDCMRYLNPDTTAAVGLTIRAYLASDYDASPPVRSVLAQTTTGTDGRWLASLMLDSGTFYIVADTQGDGMQSNQIKVRVP